MYKYLPDYIAQGISDIDYKRLYDMGIRGLCFDIDNTLVGMYDEEIHKKALALINNLKNMGFSICILSNASKKRTALIATGFGLEYVYRAFKPLKQGFLTVLRILNLEPHKCAMIGDQLFTDIRGGKKAGFLTVMTKRMNNHESLYVRFKRIFEDRIMRKYIKGIEKI